MLMLSLALPWRPPDYSGRWPPVNTDLMMAAARSSSCAHHSSVLWLNRRFTIMNTSCPIARAATLCARSTSSPALKSGLQ